MNEKRTAKKAYQLGRHHFSKGDYSKAISSFDRAREVSTRYFFNEETVYLLSKSWYYHGNINKSLDIINTGLEYSPGYLDALELKLSLLEELGKIDESKKLSQNIDKLKNSIENADLNSYLNG